MKLADNFDVRDLGNLDLLAKQVVEGFIIGLHKSPFHGFSVEFAEHRIYNQGESTKNIDWKVFARTNKMYTKRYEEETNLRCQIVIDASSSMYFPELGNKGESFNKLQFSVLAALALMNLLKKQRDAYGLSVFDQEIQRHTKAKSSTAHYRLLMSYLQELLDNPAQQKSTSVAQSLHQIADSIHKRSLVMIFSDMFEQIDGREKLFSALQHLKYNKHEVVLFHVVDKKYEQDFGFKNRPYLFIDVETGEEVKVQSNQAKQSYIDKIKELKEEVKLKCLQYKIDFVEVDVREDIQQSFKPILQNYLVKRSRMGT